MDLFGAIRVLASVAETGSFTATAGRLGMSTSSVARQMDGLEVRVGVPLLTRTTRKVALTQDGRRFLAHGLRAQKDVEATIARLRDDLEQPSGQLRVTAAPSVGRSLLPRPLLSFAEAYPKIDLDLMITDRVVDLAEAGIDLAVRVGDPAAYVDLVVRDLLPMRRVVCGSPDYFHARGVPQRPEDLEHHSCLLFRPPEIDDPWRSKRDAWTFRKGERSQKVWVSGRVSSSDADALVAAACGHLGLVMMPDWMLGQDLRSGRLCRVLCDHAAGEDDLKTLHMAYPPAQRNAPKLVAFRQHLQRWFEENAPIDN